MGGVTNCKDCEEGQCRRTRHGPQKCHDQCGRITCRRVYTACCARCVIHEDFHAKSSLTGGWEARKAGWKNEDREEGWVCPSCITAERLEAGKL